MLISNGTLQRGQVLNREQRNLVTFQLKWEYPAYRNEVRHLLKKPALFNQDILGVTAFRTYKDRVKGEPPSVNEIAILEMLVKDYIVQRIQSQLAGAGEPGRFRYLNSNDKVVVDAEFQFEGQDVIIAGRDFK